MVGRMPARPVAPPTSSTHDARATIRQRPGMDHGPQLRPQQAVEAEGDENGADRCAHVRCRQPAQKFYSDGDADLAADHQRQQAPPVERVRSFHTA